MNVFVKASFASVIILLFSTTSYSQGGSPFLGEWKFEVVYVGGDPAGCSSTPLHASVVIDANGNADGSFTNGLTGLYEVSGVVLNSGNVEIVAQGYERARFIGLLEGPIGRGTWRSESCKGKWTGTRSSPVRGNSVSSQTAPATTVKPVPETETPSSIRGRLESVKKLLDSGLITKEEAEIKRNEILEDI